MWSGVEEREGLEMEMVLITPIVFFLFLSLCGCYGLNNTSYETEDGESIKVRDAFMDLNSPTGPDSISCQTLFMTFQNCGRQVALWQF